MEFYSVSRRNKYKEGESLVLHREDFIQREKSKQSDVYTLEHITNYLKENYPDGLSLHGWDYLFTQGSYDFDKQPFFVNNICIDGIFECIRKLNFPDKPSRLQSYYACDNLDSLKMYFQPEMKIYKLEAEKFFKADEKWLKSGNLINTLMCAEKYWSGEASSNPNWEYLLVPPVKVLEVVGQ